jgi:hypothetical protein
MAYRYVALMVALVALVGGMVLLRADNTEPIQPINTIQTDIPGLANYREALVHYAIITRPDNRSRDLFISPGAAEMIANNSTARLPNGTVIVIEGYHVRSAGGQFERTGLADNIHAAVKSDDWTAADYQTNERAGSWNYFSFDPETGAMSDESVFECFDCHSNNSQIDFIFSRDNLAEFGTTGQLVDEFCNLPNRIPCR